MARISDERKSKLQKIREKLAQSGLGGGGFWKPKVGANRIRILPGVGEMEFCWVNVGQHYISRSNRHFCPDFTLDKPCPICDLVWELFSAGDDASKQTASRLRVSQEYWMNVIDRNDEDRGPQIFTPRVMIFRQIGDGLLGDPEYGDLLFDPGDGVDLSIKRTGEGMNTRYDVLPATRELVPLHDDPRVVERWLEAAKDLTPVEAGEGVDLSAPVVVESLERLQAVLDTIAGSTDEGDEDLDEDMPFPDEEEEEEEDDIDRRIRTRRSAARTRRTRRA